MIFYIAVVLLMGVVAKGVGYIVKEKRRIYFVCGCVVVFDDKVVLEFVEHV